MSCANILPCVICHGPLAPEAGRPVETGFPAGAEHAEYRLGSTVGGRSRDLYVASLARQRRVLVQRVLRRVARGDFVARLRSTLRVGRRTRRALGGCSAVHRGPPAVVQRWLRPALRQAARLASTGV